MALADLTKQLAQQAILSATEKSEKPAPPDTVGAVLLGQIHAMQANVRHAASVEAAAREADVVINLVGILFERGRQRFDAVQSFGAEAVARAAAAVGARLIHVSAIGADEGAPSCYARSKAVGERLVLAAVPSAVIMLAPGLLITAVLDDTTCR